MRKAMTDIVGGGLFSILGVAALYIIPFQVQDDGGLDVVSPSTFPELVAWSMVVLGLGLCAWGGWKLRKGRPSDAGGSPLSFFRFRREEIWAVAVVFLLVLYAYIFPRTPYLFSSSFIACLMLAVFRVRK